MFMGAKRLAAGGSASSQLELPYPWYACARQRLSGILKSVIECLACPADRGCVKVSATLRSNSRAPYPHSVNIWKRGKKTISDQFLHDALRRSWARNQMGNVISIDMTWNLVRLTTF